MASSAEHSCVINQVMEVLKASGRDVYVKKTSSAIGHNQWMDVPTIREKQSGFKGKFRDWKFNRIQGSYGCTDLIRDLGGVLYKMGDNLTDINDELTKQAVAAVYDRQHGIKDKAEKMAAQPIPFACGNQKIVSLKSSIARLLGNTL